jgi:hypothetical protein
MKAVPRRLVTLADAAKAVGKLPHNLRDYIQRGRIGKYDPSGRRIARARAGELRIDLDELRAFLHRVEADLGRHLHPGVHPELSFFDIPERERTKHVHRLHPYLGKFIPQLVEWFLTRYFSPGDVVLDPFVGCGTTLIQANELGMPSIGIDVAEFNYRIARAKAQVYDLHRLRHEVLDAERRTRRWSEAKHRDTPASPTPPTARRSTYLRRWFAPRAIREILYYRHLIDSGRYVNTDLLRILLSRAARSARLVPHDDLATPTTPVPVGVPYWCTKHRRACLPIDNAITKIHAYTEDTLRRVAAFAAVRTDAPITVLHADARTVDLGETRVNGIFTSPPYVGQVDYHDQHAYAYELFGLCRADELEIGRRADGKSARARRAYVEGIAAALRNVARFLGPDAPVFIVANDRYRLYPEIARLAGFMIVEERLRAVTKRTEKGNDPYQESIFRLRRVE